MHGNPVSNKDILARKCDEQQTGAAARFFERVGSCRPVKIGVGPVFCTNQWNSQFCIKIPTFWIPWQQGSIRAKIQWCH